MPPAAQRKRVRFEQGDACKLNAGLGEPFDAVLKDVAGLAPFSDIVVVLQLAVPTTQGDPLYFNALALQREDFAANEAVADLRVLIDEISYAHRQSINP